MSASGWSSADVPLLSVSKAGSTKLTLGRFPCATVSMNDGVVTGIPTASVSPAAKGCQNGKYFVPHSARKGRSRKKYPPVGMPWLLGMGDNWSQMAGSAEIVNELWSRSVRAACW